jgi:hypothetical protein
LKEPFELIVNLKTKISMKRDPTGLCCEVRLEIYRGLLLKHILVAKETLRVLA